MKIIAGKPSGKDWSCRESNLRAAAKREKKETRTKDRKSERGGTTQERSSHGKKKWGEVRREP